LMYSAPISNDMSGFYKSVYKNKGEEKKIFSTQFESTYARRALPCWDEPIYKAVFYLSIAAPSHLTVLSNSPEQESIANPTFSEKEIAYVEKGVEYKRVIFEP